MVDGSTEDSQDRLCGDPDDVGFAPDDPDDGHDPWDWESKWPDAARKRMRHEAAYLVVVFVCSVAGLAALWLLPTLPVRLPAGWPTAEKYSLAIVGGALGGTLLSMKWLYHSIAKGKWHVDRAYWRYMTPLVSGGFALIMMLLLSSGLLVIIDRDALQVRSVALAVSALVGLFSDSAVAKMSEIAHATFGVAERHGGHDHGHPSRRK